MIVPEFALSLMADHADAGLDSDKEIMGLMIGRFYRDDKGVYAVVDRPISSKLISDRFGVRFDESSISDLFDSLEMEEGGGGVCGTACVAGFAASCKGFVSMVLGVSGILKMGRKGRKGWKRF